MRRDWTATDRTAAQAHGCRVCGRVGPLERAHVIGRARDHGRPAAEDVVMLCGPTPHGCHGAYDRHELDLYPRLTVPELRAATARAGGPGLALRRLMGKAWRSAPGELLDHRLARLEDLCHR